MRADFEKVVNYSSEGKVGSIEMNRPKANCYDLNFMKQLEQAVDAANEDDSVHVVLLRSSLARFFCAGADLHAFAENDEQINQELADLARSVAGKLEESDKIFITLLSGHTLGGGLEIAMACDLRFAAKGEYCIGLPEAKLGLLPANGGTQRLARLVGSSKALELMLTGESINPEEGLRIGLINRLFPAESFYDDARAFARDLSEGAPLVLRALKRSVREGMEMSLSEGLSLEKRLASPLYSSYDAAEGLASFREKRKANFQGR